MGSIVAAIIIAIAMDAVGSRMVLAVTRLAKAHEDANQIARKIRRGT